MCFSVNGVPCVYVIAVIPTNEVYEKIPTTTLLWRQGCSNLAGAEPTGIVLILLQHINTLSSSAAPPPLRHRHSSNKMNKECRWKLHRWWGDRTGHAKNCLFWFELCLYFHLLSGLLICLSRTSMPRGCSLPGSREPLGEARRSGGGRPLGWWRIS